MGSLQEEERLLLEDGLIQVPLSLSLFIFFHLKVVIFCIDFECRNFKNLIFDVNNVELLWERTGFLVKRSAIPEQLLGILNFLC